MDKKELNFLLNISRILTGQESATKEEIDEILKYLNTNFKTAYLEIDESYKEIDHKLTEPKPEKQKKYGRDIKRSIIRNPKRNDIKVRNGTDINV